ncbi:MAG: hypothetical protein HXX15_15455 [Rhodopseudomonas sp.]|uniref:hypothetical protein n=1 Tax=Rhodopseudomonas sp. TaxID=1078 RepID=UPI0017C0C4CA|nr:hypothetical protein [Rhodopseudomonas sp.]NVN87473.1 hypothetical protein [Rhodopseudomonas sp.]
MPAFTFEKISPPRRGPVPSNAPAPDSDSKPRGVIVQMLDRFVESRVKRAVPKPDGILARGRKLPK